MVINNNELIENGIEIENKWISFLKSIFGENTKWVKTSYNTKGNKYYNFDQTLGDQSKAFRKNAAQIGGSYDPINDGFYNIKPYLQWILNNSTFVWEPPFPMPETPVDFVLINWNEQYGTWEKIEFQTEINEENIEIILEINGIRQEKLRKLWNNQLSIWEDII